MDTAHKCKATTRLEESDKAFAKRLKDGQNWHQQVQSASETLTSEISTPVTQPGTPANADDANDKDSNYDIEVLDDPPNTSDPDQAEDGQGKKALVDSQEDLGESTIIPCEQWLISNSEDKLYKTYRSPIYVFYLPPMFKIEDKKHLQVFWCAAKECITLGGHIIKRNMLTGDRSSTSNLNGHASKYFGEDAIASAMNMKDLRVAHDVMKDKINLWRSGSIKAAFEHVAQGKVTCSTKPPTILEVCANHVCWMCESKQPFELVKDAGYHLNMKSGWPQQYILAPTTVAEDVQQVFLGGQKLIAIVLWVRNTFRTMSDIVSNPQKCAPTQAHEGKLHFGTDCWMSPNQQVYMAVTVQYATKGVMNVWLLDIVEVTHRHTGAELAAQFVKVLDAFGISDKVSDSA